MKKNLSSPASGALRNQRQFQIVNVFIFEPILRGIRVFHVSANFVPGTELSPGDKRDKRGQMGQTGTKRTNGDKKDKRGQKGQTENSTCEEFFCLSIYLVVVPVRRSSVKPSLRGVTRTLSIYGSSSTGT